MESGPCPFRVSPLALLDCEPQEGWEQPAPSPAPISPGAQPHRMLANLQLCQGEPARVGLWEGRCPGPAWPRWSLSWRLEVGKELTLGNLDTAGWPTFHTVSPPES